MLRALATGILARRLSRSVNRRTGNPILRMAGLAAAGYVANRLVRGRPKPRPQRSPMRGYAARTG